jgi:hypothetical protein
MRPQRGSSSTLVVLTVAVVAGALLATPLVLMARQQGDRAEDALDEVDRAQEFLVRSRLDAALRAAEIYHANTGTFAGFDASAAAELDPEIRFTRSQALVPGEITIRVATDGSVLLVTASPTGAPLCASSIRGTVTYGRVDAMRPEDCTGGI